MFLFSNFRDAVVDVKNYLLLLSIIKKNKNTPEWNSLNLRTDWIGRIYTVINLQKQDFSDTEDIRRLKINKQLAAPVYNYLTERLNLVELLTTKLEYIEGTYSYLLYFNPWFRQLSLWYVIKLAIFGMLSYFLFGLLNGPFWLGKIISFLVANNILKH